MEKGASLDAARAAKPKALAAFSELAEVNGVGITRAGEGYAVKVNLRVRPRPEVVLPGEVDGVPVVVEVVGSITKQPLSKS